MIEYQQGVTYYVLTFADKDFTMPGVKPLVYVGTNLAEEDEGSSSVTHYFQTTVSYMRFGLATNPHTEGEVDLIPFDGRQLRDVYDLEGIVAEVSAAAARAAALGHPRLKSLPGNWV